MSARAEERRLRALLEQAAEAEAAALALLDRLGLPRPPKEEDA